MSAIFHSFTSLFEILVITIVINYLLAFFWNTRSMDVVLGLLAILFAFAFASWLNFPILHRIIGLLSNTALLGLLIIFQPEMRVALSKLSPKGRRYKEVTEFDKFLDHLGTSVYRLAEKRLGALILLENEDSLDDFASKAIQLNATFSSELLESIFDITTPLHDGAVIIRNTTILAASVILPLAEDSLQLTRSMGTRHRAALGASQLTDAVIIIISEEAGRVSIARDGVMTPGVKIDRFKGIIRSIFTPPTPMDTNFKSKLNFRNWFQK
ncbi:MAG TPA: diadenylate cyclase [Candidatus Rhabdochlamydia sp.]|jgi:diadenylate cyclase|nr:diadenylate cyclase [Candidatus Rhabdochlamydia sp.]